MKISSNECGRASSNPAAGAEEKILPEGMLRKRSEAAKVAHVTPLEHGIRVAEEALKDVPDVREDIVEELKQRIKNGEYKVSGEDIADMMMRRRAADRIR